MHLSSKSLRVPEENYKPYQAKKFQNKPAPCYWQLLDQGFFLVSHPSICHSSRSIVQQSIVKLRWAIAQQQLCKTDSQNRPSDHCKLITCSPWQYKNSSVCNGKCLLIWQAYFRSSLTKAANCRRFMRDWATCMQGT